MSRLAEVARSGVDAVLLHPVRNAVTALCVTALLLPYLAGVAIARGLLEQAEDSIRLGADAYVGADRFGTPVPLPLTAVERIAALPGVERVVPRIVGPIVLGTNREPAVLVGLPREAVPTDLAAVRGRLFAPGAVNELVVGSALAAALDLDVGDQVPPFYRSAGGERISTVVGVFRPGATIWQSRMVFTSLETAAAIADQPETVTDCLVTFGDAAPDEVAAAIRRMDFSAGTAGRLRPRVTTRADLEALVPRDLLHTEGVYHALFALVLATGIPIVIVSSGVGLSTRRRETGLLRATGWRVDEVLLRSVCESLSVATGAGCLAVILSWAWLSLAGGVGVAAVFLRGADVLPGFDIPFRMAPLPVLLGFCLAFTFVLTGTVSAIWRAASVPPAAAMS